ncbi:MAG: GNAT family N-acetyltransferase [Candidatus Paceibacterota bacterium]
MENNPFNIQLPPDKKENSNEKTKVEVRLALPEEWKELRDFRLDLLNEESDNSYVATPRQIREIKKRTDEQWKDILFGKDRFSVAARNSKVVGMGRAEKKEGIWYLYNLGVKKELKRKGIGSSVTAVRLKEIEIRGGKEVHIFINKKNEPSLKNAESFGFKRDNTLLGRLKGLMIIDDIDNPITAKRIKEVLERKIE